jgi:hypothetical protein
MNCSLSTWKRVGVRARSAIAGPGPACAGDLTAERLVKNARWKSWSWLVGKDVVAGRALA